MKESKLTIDSDLVKSIKQILADARLNVATVINQTLVNTYWMIGKEIVESERKNDVDNQTSRQIILTLSKVLTREVGKGFSRSNLFNMRRLFVEYPSVQTVSGHLNWSHICELLVIEDKDKRSFYEKEAINSHWSIRELKRQIDKRTTRSPGR